MTVLPSAPPAPFRDLERALLWRRFRGTELRLRVEIAAFAVLLSAFCGWKARVPLDGLTRAGGPAPAARAVALGAAALAALAGVVAGVGHARRLRRAASGAGLALPWLSLPVAPGELARHLAWESRLGALWAVVPALGGLVAAAGLVPVLLLAGIAAGFALLLAAAAHAGCAVAFQVAARAAPGPGTPGAARLHPLERILLSTPSEPRPARRDAARRGIGRWRRIPAWAALWLKDLQLSLRGTPARERARSTLLVLVLAALAWRLPVEPALARLLAFALSLAGAVALAEWLVELAGLDPFVALRVLPLGVAPVWGARVLWAAAGTALVVLLHLLAVPDLTARALRVFLTWVAGATLAIGILGAQYGITLYPRTEHARRVLGLTLGLAVAASLMIPLLGWVLLLAALLHSARRLPRWAASEES